MSYRNNTRNSEGPAATSITGTTRKESSAKVTDADFLESVIEPYGIIILTRGFRTKPMKHFGITEFGKDGRNRVQTYKTKFPDFNLWLEYDDIEPYYNPSADSITFMNKENFTVIVIPIIDGELLYSYIF
ncbi:hypothetical protein F4679DRAFT_586064 [Xylaria curta]|nr:hypothetical protein F4679DRAFT_586064 [Xylaria curta]